MGASARRSQERIVLQVSHYPFGPQMGGGTGPWFRKLAADSEASDADDDERKRAAQEHFDAVDLKDLDKLGDDFKPVEMPGMQPGSLRSARSASTPSSATSSSARQSPATRAPGNPPS